MSKKTKDEPIDFIYSNNINSKKIKNKGKSKRKNKNVPKKTKEDVINLDNEIIIGLTPKKEPKEKKSKNQTTNKKSNNKSNIKNKANSSKELKKNINQNNKKNVKKPKKQINAKTKEKRAKIFKWTSIVLIAVGAIILFMLSPIFNVKQINIEGIQKLSSEQIINLSQIKLNQNTFKIRGIDVIKRIESNTYVEKVYIKRELPSTIKITIKERVPKYIIEIGNGNAYIDSKGYILEIAEEKPQLPIINGYSTSTEAIIDFENTKRLCDEDCKKLETVNQIVEAAENNDILTYITSINILDIKNIDLYLESEKKIAHFGDGSNAINRISYLKKMIEEEAGKEGEAFINGDLSSRQPKPKPYFREKV